MTSPITLREPESRQRPLRASRIGILAGIAAISCCVYPVVLFLFGAASATQAVAIGTDLYGQWGWVFKLAGASMAVSGVVVQLRKRGQCSVKGALSSWKFLFRVVGVTVGVYCAVYYATTALAAKES